VQSRYQNIRLRPMTVDLDSLRTTREYLWSPASPRPMPGAKVSPRTILKPIEMARKNTARELQLELMGDMAGQRRTSTQVSPSLTSQKSIKAARRTVSSFAAAAMEDFEEVDNNQNGLDFEEFKNFFHKRLGPVPAADDFAATPDVEKRDWFQALDVNDNGLLTRGELFGFVLLQASLNSGEYDLVALLRSYRELRGSTISLDQLTSVVVKNGFPEDTGVEVMSLIDTNRSGVIEFAELGQWVRKAKIGLKVASADPTGGLSNLCNLLAKGRAEQAEAKMALVQARIDAFASAGPEQREINHALGSVMTTRQDVLAAEELGRRFREALAAKAPADADFATHVRDTVRAWDLMKTDGLISVRELHQGLVLLGIVDATGGAIQELFDELDEEGTDRVTLEDVTEFVLEREADEPFRRRDNEYLK